MRIGEALSLFIEDIIFDHGNGHKIKLTYRHNLENAARLKSGERDLYVSQDLMDLYDDYIYYIFDEYAVDTDFLFIKLKGESK